MTNPQHEALVEAIVGRAIGRALRAEVDPVLSFDISHRMEEKKQAILEAVAAIAALSATAATPSDEVVRLREALRAVSEGDVPRTEGKKWREDGAPSKHDQCSHGVWMYEDCGECTSDFARAALEPQAKDVGAGT